MIAPLDKAERDQILLALAILSLDRPGCLEYCGELAGRIGELSFPPPVDARADMLKFRRLNSDRWAAAPPQPLL